MSDTVLSLEVNPRGTGSSAEVQARPAVRDELEQSKQMMQEATAIASQGTNEAARSEQERVFKKDSYWFFRTREGAPKGPYIDKQHAYWALAKYIRQQCAFR